MNTIGCDMGSLFTKIVLLSEDHGLLAREVVATGGTIGEQVPQLIATLLERAGLRAREVELIAATGRGADLVQQAELVEDEMTCVGVAVRHFLPDVEQVLEVGGQNITAIGLDAEGDVVDFVRNDKCASGTGRFLEVMSEALGLPIAELDASAARSTRHVHLSSQCGVFVESEVITHLNAGVPPADVGAGLCDAVARIIVSQAGRLGQAGSFTLTGGVARLQTVVQMVRDRLAPRRHLPFPQDPQLCAALGAALLAAE